MPIAFVDHQTGLECEKKNNDDDGPDEVHKILIAKNILKSYTRARGGTSATD